MIELKSLALQLGDFALENVSLNLADGEYFVLMGRTGAGKTLVIKCICGLIRPSGGSIVLDGRDVTRLEPRFRHVGYVPQDCGMFPNMNVARNITFALRARGMSWRQGLKEVRPLVEMLSLETLMDRGTRDLSGGERQKAALARALAARPKVLLLDEPVSALDEPTRRDVCEELRRIQRTFGVTTVHVCHNTAEARAVADRVGIIHAGRLVQTGTLEELTANPADETVASLLDV